MFFTRVVLTEGPLYFVSENALFRLSDNYLVANAACIVERNQTGVYLLLCELVGFSVQIYQPQRILEVSETGFDPPTHMIQLPYVLKRK